MIDGDLIQRGIAVFESGNRATAALIFYRLTRREPHNQAAWVWLADCTDRLEDRYHFLNVAVSIDPDSQMGRRAARKLVYLRYLSLPARLTQVLRSGRWGNYASDMLATLRQRLSVPSGPVVRQE